ncbi:MAG: histidinol-phosphatase [Synergistaceae bacterium]|nr:histidinol-phosphatase [Synergistaceae bacterium]
MILADFHMHTRFCDGRDEPEAMVEAALRLGMKRMGFSGHAHTPLDPLSCMSPETTEAYKREIARLKEKYKDRIEIFCGVEQDYFSDLPTDDYDYVIGSVHTLHVGGEPRHVDWGADRLKAAIDEGFNGDPYALVEAYYRQEADVVNRTGADIIGHFDLLTKFNETEPLFDEEHPRYVAASNAALDALLETGKPFEINTGAISRGCRTTPYPSRRLMRRIAERGGTAVLSSDSHRAETLCFQFEECRALAESVGLRIVDFVP